MQTLYLDANTTTPVAPQVADSMRPFFHEHFGNPTSGHALGRACHEAVEDARVRLGRLIDAARDEILFTSGGTESNNLALKGVALRYARGGTGHVVVSSIEHASVLGAAAWLEQMGYAVSWVGCDGQGLVDPAAVEAALTPETVLVSVMHANHETGAIQPIEQIAALCRSRRVLLHTDGSQSVGRIPASAKKLGVDLMTISGHKMYAPKGIGALYVRRGVMLEPLLHGGGEEAGLRSGTLNVPGAVGLGHAAALCAENMPAAPRIARLRDRLERLLRESVGGGLVIHSGKIARLPNTLSVAFPHRSAEAMLRRIPELIASSPCARRDAPESLSPTLAAMGVSTAEAEGTIRLSLTWYTSDEQIDRAAELLLSAFESAGTAGGM